MPKLNRNKAYILPDKGPETVGTPITDDELKALLVSLGKHLSEAEQETLSKRINEHIGPDSTYTLKNNILSGLKVIHDRMMNPKTSSNEKSMIAMKFFERAENCTPGFHGGVDTIIDGFFSAKNMNDLLYRMRHNLVSNMANQLTDEVHAYNRCFTVASISGYGMRPINAKDTYTGILSDETIQKNLADTFGKKMRLFSVLQGLEDELHGQLVQTGYEGSKTKWQVAHIDDTLKTLFSHLPVIRELNAASLAKTEHLEAETLAKKEAIESLEKLIEANPDAFPDSKNYLQPKRNALLGMGTSLPVFKNWADITTKSLSTTYPEIYAQLTQIKATWDQKKSSPMAIAETERTCLAAYHEQFYIMTDQGIQDLNWPKIRRLIWEQVQEEGYFEYTTDENTLFGTLFGPNQQPKTLAPTLIKFLKDKDSIDVVQALNYFNQIDLETQKDIAQNYIDNSQNKYQTFIELRRSLMNTDLKKSLVQNYFEQFKSTLKIDLPSLISILLELGPQQLQSLFEEENIQFLFDMSIKKGAREVKSLLNAVNLLDDPKKTDILTQILTRKMSNDTIIKWFLLIIFSLTDTSRLLNQFRNEQGNALLYAENYNIAATLPLLECAVSLNSQPLMKQLLTQVNSKGENMLLRSILHGQATQTFDIILKNLTPDHISTLIQTSQYGTNAFTQAAHHDPNKLLKLLNNLPEGFPEETLISALTQISNSGYSALMYLAKLHPTYLDQFTEALKKKLSPEKVTHVLVHSCQISYFTCLKILLRDRIELLPLMINPLRILLLKLTSIMKMRNTNPIILAAEHTPDHMETLLKTLDALPEKTKIDLLNSLNSTRSNALMLIIEKAPEKSLCLFDFIGKLQSSTAKLAILSQAKNALVEKVKSNDLLFQATLNCISTLKTTHQKKFYDQLPDSKLKTYGLRELNIRKLINFLDKQPELSELSKELRQAFDTYQKTTKTPQDTQNLFIVAAVILDDREFKMREKFAKVAHTSHDPSLVDELSKDLKAFAKSYTPYTKP